MKTKSIWLAVLAAGLAVSAQAQTRIDTVDQSRGRQELISKEKKVSARTGEVVSELYAGELQEAGPQYILKYDPRRSWLDAMADVQYYYTSNVFLTENPTHNATEDTGLLVSTAQVALAPNPGFQAGEGILFPRLGFRHQWYNYGLDSTDNGLNNFDFDAQTVFADLRYVYKDSWVFKGGFDWQRLLGHESPGSGDNDYAEFYKEYVPWLGADKYFTLVDETLFFVAGYDIRYRFTDVDPIFGLSSFRNDRLDQTANLGLIYAPVENLFLQPYYRLQYTHYTRDSNSERDDFLHTFGFSASYRLTDWARVRGFVSYDIRDSDQNIPGGAPDYKVLNVGGGLTLNFAY